ncbi:MAG: glycosyltransferase family 4 protein [Myxococcota bacterium]
MVLANGTHPFVYASIAAASAGVRVGQWLHDPPPFSDGNVGMDEHLVHLLRGDALLLCNSRFTLRAAEKTRPAGARLALTPPGQAVHPGDDTTTREARLQWGLRDDQVVLGFAGRMGALKGVWHLAHALTARADLAGRVQLFLVGGDNLGREGGVATRVGEMLRAAGYHVVMPGHVQDLRPCLLAMDFLVAPSVFPETFGLSVLEAMAFGLPVIASRIGALPELVVDGETGWVVPPGDEPALGNAVAAAVMDAAERTRRGQRARALVKRRYSIERMVHAFETAVAGADTSLVGDAL